MSKTGARKRVLYLVYWGAMEPLGRSLVIPAVLGLARGGAELTLISFEKATDLQNVVEIKKTKAMFERAGVRWHPLRYHRTPKWPATALDAFIALVHALRLRMREGFDIVHARTFVAGPVGYLIAHLMGARFVYHNEGFYPDEQVDAGVWKEGSFVHRLAGRIEGYLYDHADAVIVLSERARKVVKSRPRVEAARTSVIVVPSAVDLEIFQPTTSPRTRREALRLVYLGSVGHRYRLDDAGRFVSALRRLAPGTTLTVISYANRALVESMLDSSGLARDAWTLKELPHRAVPAELRLHDAGLLFWPVGLSEHGCSPTKVGEYWASGLPVVTSPNISDTDAIVRRDRVGVVVDPAREGSFEDGALELLLILADKDLAHRCRSAAVRVYSLEDSCRRQEHLYSSLVS